MSFEEHFQKLEQILGKLEGGELSLDASLKEYEAGVEALRTCRGILSEAKLRVEELAPSGVEDA